MQKIGFFILGTLIVLPAAWPQASSSRLHDSPLVLLIGKNGAGKDVGKRKTWLTQ